ncbi:RNA polymerase sigma factor [Chengkuizengella axinellae]|uniref:RNA polymerase sigma factor n=1 Tax=Chengkuizengella axinellae TaxID=3064388 RepID=A0ABT9IYB8_9BACL|nr:RNA polymerase sigma factor [Chengkuizengella sp. 2205SS18-9]MDP5274142.1 RNA polymerase sigma factor [Chengkuizengella sp. 2205SS18-9]
MATDHELIQEIQGGSDAATEVLVKKYYNIIYAFIYRKTGDKHLAYDLTQEVFIKMMKNIPSYSTKKGNFKSWLFTIAVNHCRDYFKSKSFRTASKIDELDDQIPSDSRDIHYIFENKEKRKEIKQAIDELPDYQKEAILLKYYHDLKIKEIAKITDANESTVKSRLKQGLSKLKSSLKQHTKVN